MMTSNRARFYASISMALSGVVVSSAAQAVFLNPNGTGEALVFPYYTVNAGNSTVITLLNTTSLGKAVKVRFLEGYNGRDVLDFNLYLSPFDVWVGQILPAGAGAGLFSNDNSCTVPKLPSSPAQAMAFSTRAFDGTSSQGKDGGPEGPERTREGYVEVIDMGGITDVAANSKGSLSAISHVNGVPENCRQVVDAWGGSGYWTANSQQDILAPLGGLAGTGTIVKVELGTVEGYLPDAIGQFYPTGATGVHTAPQSLLPNLSSATSLTSVTYPNGAPIVATFARGVDAVSSIFMVDTLSNEYWTAGGAAATSEWVLVFPTKRYYTDPYLVGSAAQAPFNAIFAAPGQSCVPAFTAFFSREEDTVAPQVSFPEDPKPLSNLCQVAQVVSFNQPASTRGTILGSAVGAYMFDTPFDNGWASIQFAGWNQKANLTSVDGRNFQGEPVSGFWAVQFVNGKVGDALANFTSLYRHRSYSSCVRADDTQQNCS